MGRFEDDLDLSTERAWSRFQARLADHVVDMGDDDVLIVEAPSWVDDEDADGSAPYVQFCAYGEDLVRCEVSSNEYLDTEHCLYPAGVDALADLGWSTPTCSRYDEDKGQGSANFFLDVERSEGDRLAVIAVTALREVFGVQHPVFLTAEGLTDDDVPAEPTPELGQPAPDSTVDPRPYELLAAHPRDHGHLQAMVAAALAPLLGHTPDPDEDGDIVVISDGDCVFVRVHDAFLVEIYAFIALGAKDRAQAAFEVLELNRESKLVKFVLVEDAIMAFLFLPAQPFAPEHLRSEVGVMLGALESIDDDLATRVGGTRPKVQEPDEPASDESAEEPESPAKAEDEPRHPAMETILQLEAERPGSVDPEMAAGICDMDRRLILELIAYSSEHEIAWRTVRDETIAAGDPDEEAVVCDGEMLRAIRMQSLLRRALRVVVERRMGRRPTGPSYDERRGRRTNQKPLPPRPNREPADPSLEEVDPDAWN